MLECLILGDSIAVGISTQRPECATIVKGGINSWSWVNKNITKNLYAKTVIISLGSNDHKYVKTKRELETIRENVKAERVFWILPQGNLKASEVPIERIQEYVNTVAKHYGDTVLPIQYVSSDNIHPTGRGYKTLANQTR
jgi:lysophospholipase L1-like esterase